ncbi:hypothetical protein BKA70DRAFT_1424516 [Coprinopsis sp. MPI-PUGE-AT-0042]|nr:hypothetical protein BKA70DRAFT_1424516 [Coprinopsis sp. MPI-PUGE-AT-0042]
MADRPNKRPRFGEPEGFAPTKPEAAKPKPKLSIQPPKFESSFEPKKRKEPEPKNLHYAVRPPPKFVLPQQQKSEQKRSVADRYPTTGALIQQVHPPEASTSAQRPPPVFPSLLLPQSAKPVQNLKRWIPPTLPPPSAPQNPVPMKPLGIPNFVLPRPPTPPPFSELDRGVERSPEKKKDRHGKPVYKKGGLAARASAYLQSHDTSLMTWRQEVANPRIPSAGPSMHARIVKIIQRPQPAPRNPKGKYRPLPAVAICQDQKTSKLHTFVFHFSPALKPHDKRLEHFCVGGRTEVWKPWRSVHAQLRPPDQPLPLPSLTPGSTQDNVSHALTDIITCSKFNITAC